MNIKDYKFPQVTKVDFAFPTFGIIPELLSEAEARGMDKWSHPYCQLFSTLFYNGGELKFKTGLDDDFKKNAWAYCRALMKSHEPKHEHKVAVCALIMSELLELPNS